MPIGTSDMPLVDIDIAINRRPLPENAAELLRQADTRVQEFLKTHGAQIPGFVPCDFETAYHAIRWVREGNLATGNLFCEWGSGFGVVAALAAMLEFDVCGIEIEGELLDASRQLAEDFDLPVDLVHGSFIPEGAQAFTEQAYSNSSSDWAWIVTDADDAYDELGLEPDDFDVIFAYPWPGEESVLSGLFERVAAEGALLLTYNQFDSVRLRRKVSRRRRR